MPPPPSSLHKRQLPQVVAVEIEQVEGHQTVLGDLLEAPGPVDPVAGKDRDFFIRDVKLDAVAVELDLVDPAITLRHPLDRGRQRRLDEAGVGALVPIAGCILRWNAMA
jgi:hypothetical protein